MTEADWLACRNRNVCWNSCDRASERKFRLFACACCRAVWHALEEDASQKAVGVAEAFADGRVGKNERLAARRAAGQFTQNRPGWNAAYVAVGSDAWYAARDIIQYATWATVPEEEEVSPEEVMAAHGRFAHLLRDLIGNPFRPVASDPTWRTQTTTQLAAAIYDEGAFDHLPILADALEEAGCTNFAILNHCRQPGEHARGCWLLDLILDKQ